MRKLAVAFLLGLAALVVNAESKKSKPVRVEKPIYCLPIKTLLEDLKNKYQEEAMVIGSSEWMPDVNMSLFINKETGTYTVIEFDDEAGCILSVGKNIRYRYPKAANML